MFINLDELPFRASVIRAEFNDTAIEESIKRSAKRLRVPLRGRAHDVRASLSAPPPNPRLLGEFRAFEPVSDVLMWNEARGLEGIDPPTSAFGPLDVLYWWPKGLYIDYGVQAVHVLSEEGDGLLLVITSNPAPVEGADSRHGFLVVRGAGVGGG